MPEFAAAQIEIQCDVRDLETARRALRCGFTFEAVRRDQRAVFSRLPHDPRDPIPPAFPELPAGGLTDGVVTLRVPNPDDLAGFAEQEEDAQTLAVSFSTEAKPRALMAALLARGELDWLVGRTAPFTIVDTASGRFAGTLHLRRQGPPGIADLGYVVHPAFRGRGYTARALRLVTAWAFEHGGFVRLELGAKRANVASQRAAIAAGYAFEGESPARLRDPDGSYSDELRYAVVKPDVVRTGRA